MAVSILDNPTAAVSAFSPIIFDVDSDRLGTAVFNTIFSVIDDGGNASYNVGPHSIQAGDVLIGAGIDVDEDLNGRQNVISVSGARIVTDKAFITGGATAGSLTQVLDNLQMKADVYKGDQEHSSIASVATDAGDAKLTLAVAPANIAVGDDVAVSGTTKTFVTINSIVTDGGKVKYDIGAHSILPGQTVLVAGVTVDPSYNGLQQVQNVSATTISTSKAFGVGSVGVTPGTVSYQVYDGVHEVLAVAGTDVTIDTPFTIDITGIAIKTTLVASARQFRISENGVNLFRFNIANKIQAQLTFDLILLGAGNEIVSSLNQGSITNYTVKFTEQFDDADGLLQDHDIAQSNVSNKGTNTANQFTEEQSLDRFFTGALPNVGLFMTTMPDKQKFRFGDFIQLSFYSTDTTLRAFVTEKTNGAQTNVIQLGDKTINMDRGILKIDTSTLLPATDEILLVVMTTGNAARTETRTYILEENCDERKPLFVFLNNQGGFDEFLFKGNTKDSVRMRKTNFEKALPLGYALTDRGPGVSGVKAIPQREALSEFLNLEQMEWLEQLFTSKQVYLQQTIDGTKEHTPVVITSGKANLYRDDEITQLKIKYKIPQRVING